MPHIILECSNNIKNLDQINPLFDQIHHILEQELPTQLSSCKGRCLVYDRYFVGAGERENGFMHLTIKMLPGRTDETKQTLAAKLLQLLKEYFQQPKLSFSVELLDLNRHYYKS
ncbi:5-carboxymethyl-2-hydroxymuconate Delta-isomerase [Legionella dresdenensis]|uniref:5-carboxymethyl-2-hydroxymuconate Delta-isomerase n=1 Tax=Legionella dresdenensis TaxID=450200 RepID=A0ABV8CG14_9GAMM